MVATVRLPAPSVTGDGGRPAHRCPRSCHTFKLIEIYEHFDALHWTTALIAPLSSSVTTIATTTTPYIFASLPSPSSCLHCWHN